MTSLIAWESPKHRHPARSDAAAHPGTGGTPARGAVSAAPCWPEVFPNSGQPNGSAKLVNASRTNSDRIPGVCLGRVDNWTGRWIFAAGLLPWFPILLRSGCCEKGWARCRGEAANSSELRVAYLRGHFWPLRREGKMPGRISFPVIFRLRIRRIPAVADRATGPIPCAIPRTVPWTTATGCG